MQPNFGCQWKIQLVGKADMESPTVQAPQLPFWVGTRPILPFLALG